jgi:hypothetical protein
LADWLLGTVTTGAVQEDPTVIVPLPVALSLLTPLTMALTLKEEVPCEAEAVVVKVKVVDRLFWLELNVKFDEAKLPVTPVGNPPCISRFAVKVEPVSVPLSTVTL